MNIKYMCIKYTVSHNKIVLNTNKIAMNDKCQVYFIIILN